MGTACTILQNRTKEGLIIKTSLKRNAFSLILITVLIMAIPAGAQYAGTPGDVPPIPDSYRLDVSITQPFPSAFRIPGIIGKEAEILYRNNGVTIARLGQECQYDITYFFEGEWGLNYEIFDWAVCISQLSPSGRYDAAFPRFDFRVYVDTGTNSVSDIRQITSEMIVE
jgi:hypothetical protein